MASYKPNKAITMRHIHYSDMIVLQQFFPGHHITGSTNMFRSLLSMITLLAPPQSI
jgi:hypothetical protein